MKTPLTESEINAILNELDERDKEIEKLDAELRALREVVRVIKTAYIFHFHSINCDGGIDAACTCGHEAILKALAATQPPAKEPI